MALHLTPEAHKIQDEVMRSIYPEYGPYMDARANGIDHENAWKIACATHAEKLYRVFFYDAAAPEDERYKWSQAPSAPEALALLKENCPNMPNPYELRLVEGAGSHLLEVLAR